MKKIKLNDIQGMLEKTEMKLVVGGRASSGRPNLEDGVGSGGAGTVGGGSRVYERLSEVVVRSGSRGTTYSGGSFGGSAGGSGAFTGSSGVGKVSSHSGGGGVGGSSLPTQKNTDPKDGISLADYNIKLNLKKDPNNCDTFASEVKNILESNTTIKGLLDYFKKETGYSLDFNRAINPAPGYEDALAATSKNADKKGITITFNEKLITNTGFKGEVGTGNGMVDNINHSVTINPEEALVKLITHEIIHAQKDALYLKALNESESYSKKSDIQAYNWMVKNGYSADTITRIFSKDAFGNIIRSSEDTEHAWMTKNSFPIIDKAIAEYKSDGVDIKKCNS